MRKIVVNVPENEYRFFMKVIKNFPFAEIDEKKSRLLEIESKLTPSKKKIWNSLKDGLHEMNLIESGDILAKSSDEFLNEI